MSPYLLARRTGVPVAVGRDRPAAAQLLIGAGCDVIVSDDGLQHYALARDCEIVVIDGDRRFGNGWLLPAGPLRETRARLASRRRRRGQRRSGAARGSVQHAARGRRARWRLSGGGIGAACRTSRAQSVHAVAGIGNPERFFNMLRAHGIEVIGSPCRSCPHPSEDIVLRRRPAGAHDREGCRKMRRLDRSSGIGTCR